MHAGMHTCLPPYELAYISHCILSCEVMLHETPYICTSIDRGQDSTKKHDFWYFLAPSIISCLNACAEICALVGSCFGGLFFLRGLGSTMHLYLSSRGPNDELNPNEITKVCSLKLELLRVRGA